MSGSFCSLELREGKEGRLGLADLCAQRGAGEGQGAEVELVVEAWEGALMAFGVA